MLQTAPFQRWQDLTTEDFNAIDPEKTVALLQAYLSGISMPEMWLKLKQLPLGGLTFTCKGASRK